MSQTSPLSSVDTAAAPAWARRYHAREYPAFAYTADVISFGIDPEGRLRALMVERGEEGPFKGERAWPGGFVEQAEDRDAQATAIRELEEETGVRSLRYIEPLRVYDENGRDPRQYAFREDESGGPRQVGARVISSGFLVLLSLSEDRIRPKAGGDAGDAFLAKAYDHLPWEDQRSPVGQGLRTSLVRILRAWAGRDQGRLSRIGWAWGWAEDDWNEERVRDRYDLLMEAGLVLEAHRNLWGVASQGSEDRGQAMAFDHRGMLADGLGRLRGKIKYVPATLQALLPGLFSMSHIHESVETILGRPVVRRNFRRALTDIHGLLEETALRGEPGRGGGPPPRLYRFLDGVRLMRLDPSIRIPFAPLK